MGWGILGIWEKRVLGLIPLPLVGRLLQPIIWQWDEGRSPAGSSAVVLGRRGTERLCHLSPEDPVSQPSTWGLLGYADPHCGLGGLWSISVARGGGRSATKISALLKPQNQLMGDKVRQELRSRKLKWGLRGLAIGFVLFLSKSALTSRLPQTLPLGFSSLFPSPSLLSQGPAHLLTVLFPKALLSSPPAPLLHHPRLEKGLSGCFLSS